MSDAQATKSQDVVGVFDDKFVQLFVSARPIHLSANPNALVMMHPKENGALLTDHIVFNPTDMELNFILSPGEYRETYRQIREIFLARRTVVIQTKTDSYPNMAIEGMPHEETAEIFDAIPLTLRLIEVKIITAQFQALPPRKVRKIEDASLVNRGEQSTETPKRQSKIIELYEKWKK